MINKMYNVKWALWKKVQYTEENYSIIRSIYIRQRIQFINVAKLLSEFKLFLSLNISTVMVI